MKNLLFTLLAVAALFASGCDTETTLLGSDTIATEVRTVVGFDRISLSGIVGANITQGTDFAVTVRTNDKLLDRLETRLNGETLEVGLVSGSFRNVTAEVDIVLPTLAGITVSGTGDAVAENFQSLTDLTIDISRTGGVNLRNCNTELLTANLSGSGDLTAFSTTATMAEVNTTRNR